MATPASVVAAAVDWLNESGGQDAGAQSQEWPE